MFTYLSCLFESIWYRKFEARGSMGSEIQKSWNLEIFVFKIFKTMKSGLDCTNLEQINSRKLIKSP